MHVVQFATSQPEASGAAEFVVRSPATMKLYDLVRRVAMRSLPVVVMGETGVGKEHVARALHELGARRGEFVAVNCGSISPHLVESAFFGHEKGAFTGAERQTRGLFEQADGGTLFLDEIGELTPRAQTVLLRVLQEKRLTRVGANHELAVDFRLVAATHRDLGAMVRARTFREDLYYRVAGARLFVPPLRERPEEIPELAAAFLRKSVAEHGDERCAFVPAAMVALQRYAWPGNVRELSNAVAFAAAVRKGTHVRPEDLPEEVLCGMNDDGTGTPPGEAGGEKETVAGPPSCLRAQVREYEAMLIREGLERTGWRVRDAARLLGLPVRTLNNKVSVYGIRE